MQTLCPESGHRTAPNWPKIRKMTMTSQFPDMTSKSFFLRCFVFLVKFSYLSKFHVNIITGSGIMTIFFYKEFTRNPENRKCPRLSFAQYLETGANMDTELCTNVSNRMLLNAAKFQVYSFYRFWVIKKKPNGMEGGGGGGKITPLPYPDETRSYPNAMIFWWMITISTCLIEGSV